LMFGATIMDFFLANLQNSNFDSSSTCSIAHRLIVLEFSHE